MLRPSYTDLINVVNSEVEPGEQPATAKRARQIIAGEEPMVPAGPGKKPLSVAVQELYMGKVKIVGDDGEEDEEKENAAGEAELSSEAAEAADAEENA